MSLIYYAEEVKRKEKLFPYFPWKFIDMKNFWRWLGGFHRDVKFGEFHFANLLQKHIKVINFPYCGGGLYMQLKFFLVREWRREANRRQSIKIYYSCTWFEIETVGLSRSFFLFFKWAFSHQRCSTFIIFCKTTLICSRIYLKNWCGVIIYNFINELLRWKEKKSKEKERKLIMIY